MLKELLKLSKINHVQRNEVDKAIHLNNPKELFSLVSSLGWRFASLIFLDPKKVTNRIRLLHNFSCHIILVNNMMGTELCVKYLKACQLSIAKFLAGQPLRSLRDLEPDLPLPRLSKSGLPSIIGVLDRRSIHSNSRSVVKFWLTVFSIYRVIKLPGKPKHSTITSPFTGDVLRLKFVER
jgi:hypothetical protein